jgi:hypothetical protein
MGGVTPRCGVWRVETAERRSFCHPRLHAELGRADRSWREWRVGRWHASTTARSWPGAASAAIAEFLDSVQRRDRPATALAAGATRKTRRYGVIRRRGSGRRARPTGVSLHARDVQPVCHPSSPFRDRRARGHSPDARRLVDPRGITTRMDDRTSPTRACGSAARADGPEGPETAGPLEVSGYDVRRMRMRAAVRAAGAGMSRADPRRAGRPPRRPRPAYRRTVR